MKIFNKFFCFLVVFCFSGFALAAELKPIILATESTYPPFESMNSEGKMVGFDIDILNGICKYMQRSCKFVNQPWDSLIPGLQLGKFDVIFGAMGITEERQKQVDFTEPYYISTGTMIADKTIQLSQGAAALKNKVIGVQGSTTYDYYLQAVYGSHVHINRYASLEDALLDLQGGRVDVVFGDTPVLLTWVNGPDNKGRYTIGAPLKDAKFFSGYGFAVKKGNPELLKQLNAGIHAIKADGSYQKIVQRYFGNAP